jgi:multiple sugar transport system ATP-binding protein
MTTIELRNIGKRYDNGVEAVRNVSLTLPAGSFTVFLGPSGCGKTTLLRMIAGLESITSGELYFGAKQMNDAPPKDRDIGMVFQNYALYPHLTVFENIAFPLRVQRVPKLEIDARVRAAAESVNLLDVLDRKPKRLSGGQRQRAALARAIVRKPRVFLFDEPLSNVDARLRQEMRGEIIRLQRLVGATCVYVTHDQTEAMTMADAIVVLHDGEVQQVGAPQEIYRQPRTLFTATFVGTPAMNCFTGEIVELDGEDGFLFHERGAENPVFIRKRLSFDFSLGGAESASPSLRRGERVIVGVRPEHLRIAPRAGSDDSARAFFGGVLRREEFLGHERHLYVETSPSEALKIARFPASEELSCAVGESVALSPAEAGYCYVFKENGARIA